MVDLIQDGQQLRLSYQEFEERARLGLIRPQSRIRFTAVTGDFWRPVGELELFRDLYCPQEVAFREAFNPGGRFPLLTFLLIALEVALFLIMTRGGRPVDLPLLVAYGAKATPLIIELGQLWRLLTANLLHAGLAHLAFNLFVFYHAGGALENTFRRGDYLWILVCSALGAMGLSLVASNTVTAGASGVVFGTLGGLVVVGHRLGPLLPRVYRRFFGWAVVPYLLLLLGMGLLDPGIDNWSHLGGLLAGGLATRGLTPALLEPPHTSHHLRWALLGAVALAMALAPLLLPRSLLPLVLTQNRQAGYQVAVPSRWRKSVEREGYRAFGNGLGTTVGVGINEYGTPLRLGEVKRRFLDHELGALARSGQLTGLRTIGEGHTQRFGLPALWVDARFQTAGLSYRLRNYLFSRGDFELYLTLGARESLFDAYRPLFERIARSFALTDPSFLTHARQAVASHPRRPGAWLALALALHRLGRFKEARAGYLRALALAPDLEPAHHHLGRLCLDYGRRLELGLTHARRALALAPGDVANPILVVRLLQALGRRQEAVKVASRALGTFPGDPELSAVH